MKPSLGTFENGRNAVVDVKTLVVSRMLVQANSGAGKSYLLRRLLEQTFGLIQQIVIDREGEFASLREKFDYIIAAPHGGDALAHPKTAKLLAIRLLETGVSAIIDISELKKHEQQTFVRIFFDAMVNSPKSLWHAVMAVLDEAHLFCPEKGSAEASAAVIDMASLGRKRGFALVAATQRLAKFNKDVAAELLNKLIGRTSLVLDVKRAAEELGMTPKEAIPRLRDLPPGQFFGYGPALWPAVELIAIGDIVTTHPKPGQRRAHAPPKPTKAIRDILPKLADLPKEAEQEARSIEELRHELTNVRRELSQAKKDGATKAELTEAYRRGRDEAGAVAMSGQVKRLQAALENVMKFVIQINAADFSKGTDLDPGELAKAMKAAVDQAMKLVDAKLAGRQKTLESLQRDGGRLIAAVQKLLTDDKVNIKLDVKKQAPFEVSTTPRPQSPRATREPADNGSLPKGEAAVLTACIMYPAGVSREQLTVLTGYKRSSRDAYIQRLRERGYVLTGDLIRATEAGLQALPGAEPLPTGDALVDFWMAKLPEGERTILGELIAAYPEPMDRAALDKAGYQRSSRDAYLQRLRAKQLVTEPARGQVKASDNLFT
jgi:hypothetical protein